MGISLIGILAGALGAARVAEQTAPLLERTGLSAGSGEAVAVVLVVIVIQVPEVVLGELVRKRLALADAERISTRVARPMNILARPGRPIVWLQQRHRSRAAHYGTRCQTGRRHHRGGAGHHARALLAVAALPSTALAQDTDWSRYTPEELGGVFVRAEAGGGVSGRGA